MFEPLETRRLRLRRFEPRDLDAHVALRRDPEVLRFQTWPRGYDEAAARTYFAEMADRQPLDGRGWFNLCLAERHGDRHAGDIGLNTEEGVVEIGVSLEPRARGLGYGEEALRRALAWLRDERGFRRFKAEIDAENAKSIALFARLGFAYTGSFPDGDVTVNVYALGLTAAPPPG